MLSYLDDRENAIKHLQVIWDALHSTNLEPDEWSDVTTAMAWITEDLGITTENNHG
jgi:hypothetical protein